MKSKKTLFLITQLSIMIIILSFMSGCALKKGALTREEARYDRLSDRAYRQMENQKYEKAVRLYTKIMTLADDPYDAYGLAKAYARLDEKELFWKAIEEAEKRGFELAWRMEEEPAFKKYRDDTRYKQIIERIKQNQIENCLKLRESGSVPAPEMAPSFDSLDALAKAFEDEEKTKLMKEWKLPYKELQIQERSRSAKKIAALKRYIKDHPGADDLQDARLAEIKTWKKMTGWSHWEKETAAGLKEAIDVYINEFPEAAEREEFEFNLIESELRGVIAGKEGCHEEDDQIPLNCNKTLPLLDRFIVQEEKTDPWITRAIGLKANCLFEMYPDHPEMAKPSYESFVERPEIPDEQKKRIDWALEIDLRRLKFLFNGAPDFIAETIDGNKISLSDLKGKVVLLDFWSPG